MKDFTKSSQYFGHRPSDQDQRAGGFLGPSIQFLVSIQIFIQILVNILQVHYQNSDSSPFETNQTIMSFFIGVVCVHFFALMESFRPTPNAIYLHISRLICYISGVLACTCLIIIIFPTLGWAILSLFTIGILLNPYNLPLVELLNGISTRLFNIYNSIRHYFTIPNNLEAESSSPTVNGNVSIEQEEGGDEQSEV